MRARLCLELSVNARLTELRPTCTRIHASSIMAICSSEKKRLEPVLVAKIFQPVEPTVCKIQRKPEQELNIAGDHKKQAELIILFAIGPSPKIPGKALKITISAKRQMAQRTKLCKTRMVCISE